ncbi:MAG: hypothetical protein ABIU09_10665 [Pyrinomonadaceae bacterium]
MTLEKGITTAAFRLSPFVTILAADTDHQIYMSRPGLLIIIIFSAISSFAQTETLTNADVVEMTKAGLSSAIVLRKIRTANTRFDVSASGLIELKKASVADNVIEKMIDRQEILPPNANTDKTPAYSESGSTPNTFISTPGAPENKKNILRSAKTIALEKTSVQPARQALEKELMKRPEFKKLNLTITRYKDTADLYVEIGYVSLSWITHRYVFRIYDRRSGAVLAAGETTSWGSLAENLARNIAKSLDTAAANPSD